MTLNPSQSPIEPPTWETSGLNQVDLFCVMFTNSASRARSCLSHEVDISSVQTSDSKVLIVGLTKSVIVIAISGMKNNFTMNFVLLLSLTLEMNFVRVWKTLHGNSQGDFVWPRKSFRQSSPEFKDH